jgi:hypothetical protein
LQPEKHPGSHIANVYPGGRKLLVAVEMVVSSLNSTAAAEANRGGGFYFRRTDTATV